MFPNAGNTGAAPPSSLTPLPPGWTAYMDAKHSREYYHHAATGSTRWTRPTSVPAPAAAVPLPQPQWPIAPQQNAQPLLQNRPVQNQNSQQRPSWQIATGQTPTSVAPARYNVQPMPMPQVQQQPQPQLRPQLQSQPQPQLRPQLQSQPQPQHNYNANQVPSQYLQTQGPPPNNAWNNQRPQQNNFTQQSNFNPQQNPQQNNFNFNPQPNHFNPQNMPPQPPNPSHVHNPQWPKRPRPPPHHNNNGGNFQHFQRTNFQRNNFQSDNFQNNNFHYNKRPRYQQQQIQPQLKSCSKCPKSLPFEAFSKRQWNLADYKRMCKTCVTDTVQANEAAMKSAAKTATVAVATDPTAAPGTAEKDPLGIRLPPTVAAAPGGNAMKACSACPKSFPKEGYSNRQWTLTGTIRKCKECVVLVVKENEANMARVSEMAKEDKRSKYGGKGPASGSQPVDDPTSACPISRRLVISHQFLRLVEGGVEKEQPSGDATQATKEDGNYESKGQGIPVPHVAISHQFLRLVEGGVEKEQPSGDAPQATKEDGNYESKGQGIPVPHVAKELMPDKPSQEIGESQLEHFVTGTLKTPAEKLVLIDKNAEGDELKHYVTEALKTSGQNETLTDKSVEGGELEQCVTEVLKTSVEKEVSVIKNIEGDELEHYVTKALNTAGEKETLIDKNIEGNEFKCADEKDQNGDACESINIDIMVSKENGNIGDEDADVKLECRSNDSMPRKEETQQEQAVEVVHEAKSDKGDCITNAAMPMKDEPDLTQAVADDALALSEQAVADDAIEPSE